MANCILMLTCKDQKGILANITNFIYQHDGNIINLEQHTDTKSKLFFMRLEWSLIRFRIQSDQIVFQLKNLFQISKMNSLLLKMKLKIFLKIQIIKITKKMI